MQKPLRTQFIWFGILVAAFTFGSCHVNSPDSSLAKTDNITIQIDGMMCEKACGGKIKKELYEIAGVKDVEVNFVNKDSINTVRVTYQPSQCSQSDMKRKIEKIGGGTLYQVEKMYSTSH